MDVREERKRRIQAAIRESGLSDSEIARRSDLSQVMVGHYRSGKSVPQDEKARALARALRLDFDELWNVEDLAGPQLSELWALRRLVQQMRTLLLVEGADLGMQGMLDSEERGTPLVQPHNTSVAEQAGFDEPDRADQARDASTLRRPR